MYGLKPRTVSARHLKKFKVYTFDEYMVGFDRSCMIFFREDTVVSVSARSHPATDAWCTTFQTL